MFVVKDREGAVVALTVSPRIVGAILEASDSSQVERLGSMESFVVDDEGFKEERAVSKVARLRGELSHVGIDAARAG